MSTETPEELRRRNRRSEGWLDELPTRTGHYLWSDGSGDNRPRYCWVTVGTGRFKDRPALVEGDWGRANAVDMGGFWMQTQPAPTVETGWVTDDVGTRTWTFEGWRIVRWSHGGVDCYGPDNDPDGRDLDYDLEEHTLSITHDAPYEGNVGVTVPMAVVLELIRVTREDAS